MKPFTKQEIEEIELLIRKRDYENLLMGFNLEKRVDDIVRIKWHYYCIKWELL